LKDFSHNGHKECKGIVEAGVSPAECFNSLAPALQRLAIIVLLSSVAEAKWANSACSPQPDIKDVIADDFQGTSPSGRRYGKNDAITTDTKSLSRDCQLGEVKVRFFGDSIAIAYGEESAVSKGKDGKETKGCLIWTTHGSNAPGNGRSWLRRIPASLASLRSHLINRSWRRGCWIFSLNKA
jgi:hypothetical protein